MLSLQALLLLIGTFLPLLAHAQKPKVEEIVEIIEQALEWQQSEGRLTREISEEHKNLLRSYSSDDIIRGFIAKLEKYDQDEQTRMKPFIGGDEASALKFNDELVPDTSFLRMQLAREKDPRRSYFLTMIATAFTEARKEDYIPELFNSLFRDGRIIKKVGEQTPDYADDISKLAYRWIIMSVDILGEEYQPPGPIGNRLPTHEEEVDHLAKWLIANWPGCENFTLSDQNVPAILAAIPSSKRTSGLSKPPNQENTNPTEETSKPSWPLLTAILLLLGSVAYWGRKRFAS